MGDPRSSPYKEIGANPRAKQAKKRKRSAEHGLFTVPEAKMPNGHKWRPQWRNGKIVAGILVCVNCDNPQFTVYMKRCKGKKK